MRVFRVYSRPGCHLCEILIEELSGLVRGRGEIEVVNIDTNTDWQAMWSSEIPVVECSGQEVCRHRLDRDAVEAILQPR